MIKLGENDISMMKLGELDLEVYKGETMIFPELPPPPILGILEQIKQSVVGGQAYYTADEKELIVKFRDTTAIGSLTVPDSEETPNLHCRCLMVAGGGAGGGMYINNKRGGGGGAGGFKDFELDDVEIGEWQVDVGAGGSNNANGQETSLNLPVATYFVEGGGYGGYWSTTPGHMGGSGGGGNYGAGGGHYEGQGNDGGFGNYETCGGGGGGFGSKGHDGYESEGELMGAGGDGVSSDIDLQPKDYAAGGSGAGSGVSTMSIGGAGSNGQNVPGGAGVDGTGSGGGSGNPGGKGGDGICILRFSLTQEEPHDSYLTFKQGDIEFDIPLSLDNQYDTNYTNLEQRIVANYSKATGLWMVTMNSSMAEGTYLPENLELNDGQDYSYLDFTPDQMKSADMSLTFHKAIK